MLVLTRKVGEVIAITTSDGVIRVSVEEVKGARVILGIQAPKEVNVVREEIQDGRAAAVKVSTDPFLPQKGA